MYFFLHNIYSSGLLIKCFYSLRTIIVLRSNLTNKSLNNGTSIINEIDICLYFYSKMLRSVGEN